MTDNSSQTDAPARVDFSELIMGFSSAALFYLGSVPIKDKKEPEINLPLARQNIDILEMLQEKTKGNLSDEENALLSHVMKDLRLKFIEASK